MKNKHVILGLMLSALLASTSLAARDNIEIVGSSTLYPFSRMVADVTQKKHHLAQPNVISTGSGKGFELFCESNHLNTADITNASRRMNSKEFEQCMEKKITVTEIKVGYDGIALINAINAPEFQLTDTAIFLAIAKEVPEIAVDGKFTGKLIPNPYKNWNEIFPTLPGQPINILGPSTTAGTYDAFLELAMESGCRSIPWVRKIRENYKESQKKGNFKKYKALKKRYKAICHSIRDDGVFNERAKDHNELLSQLTKNPQLLVIDSFSFLKENSDKLQGASINGRKISFSTISDGSYPLSRPLFMYVKHSHIDKVTGIKEYIAEFISEEAWGVEGYLVKKGMIPMLATERQKYKAIASEMRPLSLPKAK